MKYSVTFLPMNDFMLFMYRITNAGREEVDDRLKSIIQNNNVEKWLRDVNATLPQATIDELRVFFQEDSRIALSIMPELYQRDALTSVDQLIDAINELDEHAIRYAITTPGFIGEGLEFETHEKRIQQLAVPESEKWKLLYFVDHIDELKRRLTALFHDVWTYYAPHQALINEAGNEAKQTFQKEEYRQFATELAEEYVNEGGDKSLVVMPSYSSNLGFSVMEQDNVVLLTVGMQRYHVIRKFHDDKEVLELLKILTDERRFQMLRLLKKRPHYGYEIAQALGVSNSTVSHHLSLLLNLGFVKSDRDENKVYYTLNQAELRQVVEALNQLFLGDE
ncbi:DNA-binding transcriptional ArsR family regulator [Alkalibacillus flavidus]|uniref:DNA-binding transcriptional ArsR family regulator n=1 Tax=Alkalibacillus flavidus TaxID=546021 RepID=A0ABV2KT05_9BACI